jgi:hypothetical protein
MTNEKRDETIRRLRERNRKVWSHNRLAERYGLSTARINQILNPTYKVKRRKAA